MENVNWKGNTLCISGSGKFPSGQQLENFVAGIVPHEKYTTETLLKMIADVQNLDLAVLIALPMLRMRNHPMLSEHALGLLELTIDNDEHLAASVFFDLYKHDLKKAIEFSMANMDKFKGELMATLLRVAWLSVCQHVGSFVDAVWIKQIKMRLRSLPHDEIVGYHQEVERFANCSYFVG